ncbi:MAG: type II secretion system protein [Burkholderiaceae bacterium]|nr:MAG: type II secretion system protein [Burkholderiaceae bacterium]
MAPPAAGLLRPFAASVASGRGRSQRGLTLIEVLVAFVVLALTLGVILQIFSGGLRNARLSDAYTRALLLAESRLEAVGSEQALVPGETAGQLGEDLRWRVRIQPWAGAAADPLAASGASRGAPPARILYEVQVQVAWQAGGRERSLRLTSLRLSDPLPERRP